MATVPTHKLIEACESYFNEHGYVKWSAVASELGLSRQAIGQRLRTACENGSFPYETYNKWRPTGPNKSRTIKPLLTPPNYKWVQEEMERLNLDESEFMNMILTELREKR